MHIIIIYNLYTSIHIYAYANMRCIIRGRLLVLLRHYFLSRDAWKAFSARARNSTISKRDKERESASILAIKRDKDREAIKRDKDGESVCPCHPSFPVSPREAPKISATC